MPDVNPLPLPDWLAALPAVNALLNGLATVLLLAGLVLIRRGRREAHKAVMLTAFAVSVLFLGCYLTYHQGLYQYTGTHGKSFGGTGLLLIVYRVILISHVVLAAAVPVLAVMTIVRGFAAERVMANGSGAAPSVPESDRPPSRDPWERHRRIARITFPVWLYVSITGVVIYLMLYHLPVDPAPGPVETAAPAESSGAA